MARKVVLQSIMKLTSDLLDVKCHHFVILSNELLTNVISLCPSELLCQNLKKFLWGVTEIFVSQEWNKRTTQKENVKKKQFLSQIFLRQYCYCFFIISELCNVTTQYKFMVIQNTTKLYCVSSVYYLVNHWFLGLTRAGMLTVLMRSLSGPRDMSRWNM